MIKNYIENKKFEKADFTEQPLPKGDYKKCSFVGCNFSGSDLTNINFSECDFISCNMSLAKVAKAVMRDVKFKDSKLLGLNFENCNPFMFSVSFDSCLLNLSSFYNLGLKKTRFKNTSLHEVDFTQADLSLAVFESCDMTRAVFKNTILDKADLRTAQNYSIDPEINSIKKAKFSMSGIPGLLHKYDIEID